MIADFLFFLFSEKKYQISTIKGYKAMISNTRKFKMGNRIGSNPVLSEFIRSFELQRPVQISLTPKWDLCWVLVSLQKSPFEPLHKASKLHIMIKTAFLARRDYVPGELMLSPKHWRRRLSASASASMLAQCLSLKGVQSFLII